MPTGSRTPIDCYISRALKLAQGAAYSLRLVAKRASLVRQGGSPDHVRDYFAVGAIRRYTPGSVRSIWRSGNRGAVKP